MTEKALADAASTENPRDDQLAVRALSGADPPGWPRVARLCGDLESHEMRQRELAINDRAAVLGRRLHIHADHMLDMLSA